MSRIVKDYLRNYTFDGKVSATIASMWQDDLDMGCRGTFPAHFTVSAILLNGSQVLRIHHIGLGLWLFPGGHLEHEEAPQDAAKRELLEETGILGRLLLDTPVHIDCHRIPANPKKMEPDHHHFDLRYLFVEVGGTLSIEFQEVSSARWIGLAGLKDIDMTLYERLERYSV